LEDKFDFFPNVSTSPSILDPCNGVSIFIPFPMPPLIFDQGFHFNLDVIAFASSYFIQVNAPLGNEVAKRTNHESLVKEPIPNFQFLKTNYKELENVDKGGLRVSKYVKLWAMNVFNEWRLFHGFDTTKSITDMFGNEGLITNHWIGYHLLFCNLQKKMATYIFQLGTILYYFLNAFMIGVFIHHVFFFFLSCLCFYRLCVSFCY